MHTLIRKKKLPVTTLLRAIGYESDKDILEIFDLADEVKVNKTQLKKVKGRKLAARVLKTWVEDFVDEDTGEVVSIERNEVIVDRETILEEEHVDIIWILDQKQFFFIKKTLTQLIMLSYITPYRKILQILKLKQLSTFIAVTKC